MENHQQPFLTVQEGPQRGQTYVLTGRLNTIGRTQDNQIVVDSTRISRRHVQLKVLPEGVFIEDLGSTNGTWVNGQRLGEARRLNPGDIIQLADYISLRYELMEEGATAKLPGSEAGSVTQAMGDTTPPTSNVSYTPAPAAALSDKPDEPALTEARSTWVYVGIGLLALLILICLAVAIYLWFAPVEFWYWLFELLGVQYP